MTDLCRPRIGHGIGERKYSSSRAMVRSHMGRSLTSGVTPTHVKKIFNLIEVNVGIKEASSAKPILAKPKSLM